LKEKPHKPLRKQEAAAAIGQVGYSKGAGNLNCALLRHTSFKLILRDSGTVWDENLIKPPKQASTQQLQTILQPHTDRSISKEHEKQPKQGSSPASGPI